LSIKKFKTFEEAEKELWIKKPDEAYFKKIFTLFDDRLYINVVNPPIGIFKYKTFEEAEKDKIQWQNRQNQ